MNYHNNSNTRGGGGGDSLEPSITSITIPAWRNGRSPSSASTNQKRDPDQEKDGFQSNYNNTKGGTYVEYQITCRGTGGRMWSVWRRYSDWLALREALCSLSNNKPGHHNASHNASHEKDGKHAKEGIVLPPALPPKASLITSLFLAPLSWIPSALSHSGNNHSTPNPDNFIATRQSALEQWCRDVLTHPQGAHWRKSKAWRDFLGLPAQSNHKSNTSAFSFASSISSTFETVASSATTGAQALYQRAVHLGSAIPRQDPPINANNDQGSFISPTSSDASWSEIHQALLSHIKAIRNMIYQAKQAASVSSPTGSGSSSADGSWYSISVEKKVIAEAESLLARLKARNESDHQSTSGSEQSAPIGKGEYGRRNQVWGRCCNELRDACRLLNATRQSIYLARGSASSSGSAAMKPPATLASGKALQEARSQLLSGPIPSDLKAGDQGAFPSPQVSDSTSATTSSLLAQQTATLQDQDTALDMLNAIIQRQKSIGLEIGNEIERQNRLVEEVSGAVDSTQSRMQTADRRLGRLRKG